MKGKIVLLPFPFTDLTASKYRPALVLHEGRRDVVVAFISSADVIVDENYPEFGLTGLKISSVIKIDKIATVLKDLVLGELGEVGPRLRKEINERLAEIYRL